MKNDKDMTTNSKKRCKCCGQFYELTKSEHVCDECYPKCVSTEPMRWKPC